MERGAAGPPGTVPIVRFNVETYLRNNRTLLGGPEHVLRKWPPFSRASRSRTTDNRYYAVWSHSGTYYGSGGTINIWNAPGPAAHDETSIAQTALFAQFTGGGESVEAGKIQCADLNGGSTDAFLFTWFTTNDWGPTGDWIGGYNTLVKGWHQVSQTKAPGMRLVSVSADGGQQIELSIEVHRNDTGDWWVWVNDEWIGYYPHCRQDLDDCRLGTSFSSAGLRDHAPNIHWYGEVYDSTAPSPTSTGMGSGKFASEGSLHAAYFRNMTHYDQPATYDWFGNDAAVSATDPACYSSSGPFTSSDASWRNWFYYGGPGSAAPNCR